MIEHDLPNDDYHARPHMSATKLKHFLKSPAHYRAAVLEEKADTPAFRLGRLVHTYVLESIEAFDREYVSFDLKRNTKAGREEYAAIIEAGLTPVTPADIEIADQIARATHDLIDEGESEVSYTAMIEGVDCQCRVDRITPDGLVFDLKTCLDVSAVDRVFYNYGYDVQAVFYEMVLRANDVPFKGMRFVFAEKTPPYDVAVREVDPAIKEAVEQQIREALRRFKACKDADKWPGIEGGDLSCKVSPAPAWRVHQVAPDVDLSGFYSDDNEAC